MTTSRWILAVALIAPLARAAPNDPDVRIEPRADTELRRMSDYLASLKSARFDATSVTDLVARDGQKIESVAEQKVAVRWPDRLRTDRQDPRMDATVRYDGRQVSVFGKRTGYYALAPAPPNITDTLEVMRTRYGIEAPAGDLLAAHVYDALMEDVKIGRYIGSEPIDGAQCAHLAFQGKDVDFQIWIEEGPRPLPRRYTIVSKRDPGEPQFSIMMSNWQVNVPLPDSVFAFQAPPGSKRVEFAPVMKQSLRGGGR
jgi:hypothetical protein